MRRLAGRNFRVRAMDLLGDCLSTRPGVPVESSFRARRRCRSTLGRCRRRCTSCRSRLVRESRQLTGNAVETCVRVTSGCTEVTCTRISRALRKATRSGARRGVRRDSSDSIRVGRGPRIRGLRGGVIHGGRLYDRGVIRQRGRLVGGVSVPDYAVSSIRVTLVCSFVTGEVSTGSCTGLRLKGRICEASCVSFLRLARRGGGVVREDFVTSRLGRICVRNVGTRRDDPLEIFLGLRRTRRMRGVSVRLEDICGGHGGELRRHVRTVGRGS